MSGDADDGVRGAGEEAYDYIVVGSGAGGGTLAARLAEAGRRVLLLEAGGDPRTLEGGVRGGDGGNRLPADYDVPAFHAFASENEAMRWDFVVRHYADDGLNRADPKHISELDGRPVDGILYPRAGTLGGCTAHNAMIMVCPHDADWDRIAELTGDDGWRADVMHGYFKKLENCHHRPWQRRLASVGIDRTGHGYDGWLHTEKAIPRRALRDERLMETVATAARVSYAESGYARKRIFDLIHSAGDPNDIDVLRSDAEGVRYTPLTTRGHKRMGSRERVLETAERHPERLTVELDALCTRVLFDDEMRAVGVEYLKGPRLYRAHARVNPDEGERHEVRASREVILAGGAFNSPQLLMLSGIGDPEQLAAKGIDCRVALPGVGRNLQDRYEVAVLHRMHFKQWETMEGARFEAGDPLYEEWRNEPGHSLYGTNGAGIALIARSSEPPPLPDLFCMALLARFIGYYPGYAQDLKDKANYLSWAILKAHTLNRAGTVRLRTSDPRDMPEVNFHYFDEGSDTSGRDLDAVVDGIRLVRRIGERLMAEGLVAEEELPGKDIDSDEELKDYARTHAWGHHASCSCAIGPREKDGVLDGRLRVHGTKGLRVVDASVFPRIPGFFIVSAVYMVGEKAADMILEDEGTDFG